MKTSIQGVDHIAIATDDLEGSLAFWEGALGIRCEHVEELPERGIKVAMLPVGATRIELVAPLHDKSEVSAFLGKRGPGIHHLALKVADVDAGVAELKGQGVKMAQDPAPGAHGCRVAFVHPKASGGVLLELSTPPKDRS
ncbi:MAG: methylmalonyl-CoA epimerase [Deltaproteobacteria bacterium]|nr:methylmalonyl-CoA epimerase [Deltaproteobacteria bacterium]